MAKWLRPRNNGSANQTNGIFGVERRERQPQSEKVRYVHLNELETRVSIGQAACEIFVGDEFQGYRFLCEYTKGLIKVKTI